MKSFTLLKHLLFVVVFSSQLLVASLSCQRPEHQPYSDELSARAVLVDTRAGVPTDGASAEEAVEALFRSKGWFACPSKHTGDHGVDGLFTKTIRGHRFVVLCETKYRTGTTRLDLSKSKCVGCARGGETKECYQMSRRWAYNAVNEIVTGAEGYCEAHRGRIAERCRVVCPEVRTDLLEGNNIFKAIRVAAVFSGAGKCRFHVLGAVDAEGKTRRLRELESGKALWELMGITPATR